MTKISLIFFFLKELKVLLKMLKNWFFKGGRNMATTLAQQRWISPIVQLNHAKGHRVDWTTSKWLLRWPKPPTTGYGYFSGRKKLVELGLHNVPRMFQFWKELRAHLICGIDHFYGMFWLHTILENSHFH